MDSLSGTTGLFPKDELKGVINTTQVCYIENGIKDIVLAIQGAKKKMNTVNDRGELITEKMSVLDTLLAEMNPQVMTLLKG